MDGMEAMAANADAVVDAAPEGIATPIEEVTETITDGEQATAPEVGTEAPEQPIEQPKVEEITETQAFSKRLKEKTAETEREIFDKVNATVAKLGGTMPDGSPIQTLEDLERALEYQELQAEAAKQDVPVEVLSRLTQAEKDALEAKNMLSQYQRKEAISAEAETLSADPAWGEFYTTHKQDIHAIAEQAGVDLATAKLIVYDRVGPQKVDEEAIANKAIQEYISGKRTSYKPVEGSGATPTQVVQAPKTYAEAREGTRALFRSLRENQT